MDILNFISWIKGGRQVTTVDATRTLIPLGLKDNRRDDGYLAGAITVQDFIGIIPPLSGPNYILIEGKGTPVENGQELYDTYAAAITKTPNGLPLSEDNRYTILLAPGIYEIPFGLQWNTDFIDLACIDGIATLTSTIFLGVPIIITANDTQISNIKIAFPFLESQQYTGWPIINNLSKVLLNNCSGYSTDFPSIPLEEFTINRDYLNTTVTRKIKQLCTTDTAIYLGFNYVDVLTSSPLKSTFFWSETRDLFIQSKFDLGSIGDFVAYSTYGGPSTYAYIETATLPLTDKYIQMQISNVVGTFSLNDIVSQGGTTGIITETDGGSYFIVYVATGIFPNGTGTITNTTSGGTADNNGWAQNGNTNLNSAAVAAYAAGGQNNFLQFNFNTGSIVNPYNVQATLLADFSSQMYIQYEGPNTSFDSGVPLTIGVYNNLGGIATSVYSTNAGELVIANLVGNWDGATTIWNDVNPTPVAITNRSEYLVHTLTKTVTNR